MTSRTRPRRAGDWATLALAILIVLFGLIFVGGGGYLLSLGGSAYYLICGIVLLASGLFMAMGRLLGGYLFLLAWAGTLVWTIAECGFDWWGWLPRLFGPTLIAILVVLSLPVLRRQDTVRPVSRGAV
ncbi:glycerol dehydrogenase [Asaia lannensis]|uniref:Glycerol dehydrogenase n=1 Tax=Asaia lannensis NBRC 102526 TaxID=1307926 RepID=A0ABT1CJ68_9PROT|nr:glycerol dehydrogenase [Asaia lannensis]MCO6160902.1 glycerol dehydrogenase [Asaia lannensis NBRC 102526]GBR01569.1 D-sorbitol dehydrogenase subunit SldB [Asaia lannensis NBRC 102526]